MKLGVSLPQTNIGTDPSVVRDFAQAAEALGCEHLAVYDHVVGVNPMSYTDWSGPYTSKHAFHDPFALFGFLAGQTEKIVLTTHVLILPQRQTALVARQAASVEGIKGRGNVPAVQYRECGIIGCIDNRGPAMEF